MSNDHLPDPVSRSGTDERDYLLKRAEDHRQLAEITDDRQARTIHLRLRKLYEEQAELVMLVLQDQHDLAKIPGTRPPAIG